jgi:hypothetical protein
MFVSPPNLIACLLFIHVSVSAKHHTLSFFHRTYIFNKHFVTDRMMQEIDLLRPNEIHKTTMVQVATLL